MNKTIQLHVKKPGLQTTIQDVGRKGFEAFGIPTSGVMDDQSYQLANWLVGNPLDSPVLEITMLGPQIEFSDDAQIVLTGANFFPRIDDLPISMYETMNIEKGKTLSFRGGQYGCRTYLAVRGIWQIEKRLGSCSTMRFDERLKKGDVITIKKQDSIIEKKINTDSFPTENHPTVFRVLTGPEFSFFSKIHIAEFFSKTFIISNDSNRMGYKLNFQLSNLQQFTELISSGIITGTIQITSAGQPIVLMKDAQTTGGYPRIANVIKADLDKLGQRRPCLLYTSPSPRDQRGSRMPSSA